MRTLTDQEAFREQAKTIYKSEGWSSLIWFFIFFSCVIGSIGTFAWHYHYEAASLWWLLLVFWVVFFMGIASMAAWARFKASLLASNWLVRTNPQSIHIRFRSFQNYRLPDTDRVALAINWQDIVSARHFVEKSAKSSGDEPSATLETFHYIELVLKLPESALEAIKIALKGERVDSFNDFKQRALARKQGQPMPKKRKIITVKPYEDYPVLLEDDSRLLIRWNGVRPKWNIALKDFAQYLDIAPATTTEIDTYDVEPTEVELDKLIRQRLARGDDFDAVSLLKEHRGLDTTEAMEFISQLKQSD